MIFLIIASICFSLSFGLIKSQLSSLPPDLVVELRLLLAGLVFLPFLPIPKKFKRAEFKKHLTAAAIGIIQFGLMYIFFIRAFKYLQGSEIVLLTTSTPILVAIFSSILGQRFKFSYLLCVLLSIIGAIVVIWDRVSFNFLLSGVLFVILADSCFALGQVLWKKYVKDSDIKFMATAYLASAFFVLPFAMYCSDFSVFSLTLGQTLSILYLGVVPTGIGFWLWNKGAKKVSPLTLAIMNNFKIPLAVLFALVIFHEKINFLHFAIGSCIILVSIILGHIIVKNK